MSIIKEIYDVAKDGVVLQRQIKSMKRALIIEAELRRKFLRDIEDGSPIDQPRKKKIISNLKITELTDAVSYEIPYTLISNKIVDQQLIENLNITRTLGYDLEKLIKQLYLMIAFLQGEADNEKIDLKSRLEFISKYNLLLLRILY